MRLNIESETTERLVALAIFFKAERRDLLVIIFKNLIFLTNLTRITRIFTNFVQIHLVVYIRDGIGQMWRTNSIMS
jgi:hypothetical protein